MSCSVSRDRVARRGVAITTTGCCVISYTLTQCRIEVLCSAVVAQCTVLVCGMVLLCVAGVVLLCCIGIVLLCPGLLCCCVE